MTLIAIRYTLISMKAWILYRARSEDARKVEEYVHEFERYKGKKLELIDLNTRDGAAIASLYDEMQQPTVMVVRDDGQLVQDWRGPHLPLMNELAGYLTA